MPGHDHSQSIGRGTPKSAMEPGVLTDPLGAKEPLVVIGRNKLRAGMRVAICREGEVGHPLISDSSGEVYLFNVWDEEGTNRLTLAVHTELSEHLKINTPSNREEVDAWTRRFHEREQMENRVNHRVDRTLRFVPVDVCPQATAPYGLVYAAFKDGESVQHDGQDVIVTIDAHGKRTIGTIPNSPITADGKFPLPKDAVLVPFRKADSANTWTLPLIGPDGTSSASVGGYFRTRREAREIFPEEKARHDIISAQLGSRLRVGRPVRIDTKVLDRDF
jgi:hypothetical protein